MTRLRLLVRVLLSGDAILRDVAVVAWQDGARSRWQPSLDEVESILRRARARLFA